MKLYDKFGKDYIKIRCIFYRNQQDHEINNPARKKKYLNRLLPDYKAYWIGYLKVRARLDDILEINDRAIKKPLPTSGDREAQAQWDKLISILSTRDEFTNYMYDTYDPAQGILAGVHIVNYQSLCVFQP